MRRRTMLPLPLLSLWPVPNGPQPHEGPKREGGPLDWPVLPPTKRTIALFAALDAALRWNVSAGVLCDLARRRSNWDPTLIRPMGATILYGLYQFEMTQWREVLLGRGTGIVDVLRTDIMDADLQADAAAYLLLHHRPIRGEGVHAT